MKIHSSALEKLCYTPWNIQGQKPRLSWLPLEMPILFLIDLWNFHIIFFQYTPKKFQVLNPPTCLEFFWNSSNCHATKIVIWLFGWNSPVHWAIQKKNPNRWGGGYAFLKTPFWKFYVCHFTFKNSGENKLSPLEILQNCVPPLGNSKEISH